MNEKKLSVCVQCGEKFQPFRYNGEDYFCSIECADKYYEDKEKKVKDKPTLGYSKAINPELMNKVQIRTTNLIKSFVNVPDQFTVILQEFRVEPIESEMVNLTLKMTVAKCNTP